MGKRIVVLGGGAAGTMVANRLARRLTDSIRSGELEILLITRSEQHLYQPGFLSVVFNEKFPEQIVREEKSLVHRGVTLVFDEIKRIRPDRRCVQSRTTEYPYDYLVIATGSRPDFDGVPGLKESAHHFYSLEGALRLRDALASVKEGRILIAVDQPHKGPGAPLEFALMLDDYLRRRGIREEIRLKYAYSDGRLHRMQPVADWALSQFEQRGIVHQPFFRLEKVDPLRKRVFTADGEEHPFDVLVAVPAHRGAPVVADSGLGDERGFVPTDRLTLKMEGDDRVYVLGDATNLPLPKGGSAYYQSEVLVQNLVSRLKGLPETSVYDGKGAFFLGNSFRDAGFIAFDYSRFPKSVSSSEVLRWFKGMQGPAYWLNVRAIL
jgi:sulfide:quinone oxidoreductase